MHAFYFTDMVAILKYDRRNQILFNMFIVVTRYEVQRVNYYLAYYEKCLLVDMR